MIGNDWDNVLKNIYDGEYFRPLLLKVQNEYKNKVLCLPFYGTLEEEYRETICEKIIDAKTNIIFE